MITPTVFIEVHKSQRYSMSNTFETNSCEKVDTTLRTELKWFRFGLKWFRFGLKWLRILYSGEGF
jgi:hypothetical protein